MALSSLSFLPIATSVFCCATQKGTSVDVTAASARVVASWFAVVLVVQPPQLKPTIMVTMLPRTAPQAPDLSNALCTFMRYLQVRRTMCEWHQNGASVAVRSPIWIVDQGPLSPGQVHRPSGYQTLREQAWVAPLAVTRADRGSRGRPRRAGCA